MKEITEARRYITNARDLLRDKGQKDGGYYQDSKYVKNAGHTAYAGVLVALDSVLPKKPKGRKDVDWYKRTTWLSWIRRFYPPLFRPMIDCTSRCRTIVTQTRSQRHLHWKKLRP